jgi:uncharacterized membrane protein
MHRIDTQPPGRRDAILRKRRIIMALTAQPLADSPQLDTLRNELATNVATNVSDSERIGSIALGAGLILIALSRRSLFGGLLGLAGAGLVARGMTGNCALYRRLGINSGELSTEAGVADQQGIKVTQTIDIEREPAEVYRHWRKLENLARFMEHVESVEEIDSERSRWVVRGPLGQQLRWDARIVNEREGELIAWESLPGAEVSNAGSVWFEPNGNGGTRLKVSLKYDPPAGMVGAAAAKLFGESPDEELRQDLGRFKEIIETSAKSPA